MLCWAHTWTRNKWGLGATATFHICTALEEFCGLTLSSGEQHKDFHEARMNRDAADISKLSTWFENHPPFPQIDIIISISSGVIGDETITCFKTLEIGSKKMIQVSSKCYSVGKLTRKGIAQSLNRMHNSIKFHDTTKTVDPLVIFQRLSLSKRSNDDLANYLQYESTPYPLSLFNDCGMCKTKKSALSQIFEQSGEILYQQQTLVVDGGFLLYEVVWKKGSTIQEFATPK